MAFKPPQNFNFNEPIQWPAWKERFSRFRIATELDKKTGIIQVSSLLYAMGGEADKLFSQFTFTNDAEKENYDIVLEKFNEHFVPARNVIHERATFHKRNQKVGETIEQYVRCLYILSEHADFPDRNETIRDRLVLGVLDQELSEKLQLEPDLTLNNAITKARQSERVKTELELQRSSAKSTDWVAKKSQKDNKKVKQIINCTRCGGDHEIRKCPAYKKKCNKCNGYNHFAKVCRGKQKKTDSIQVNPNYEFNESNDRNDHSKVNERQHVFFVDSMQNAEDDSPWRVKLNVNQTPVDFKIDTGADVNLIGQKCHESIGKPMLQSCKNIHLQSPGGRVNPLGFFYANLRHNKNKKRVRIYVVEGNRVDNLLSRSTACGLKLVQRLDKVEHVNNEPTKPFAKLNCTPVKLRLIDNAQPYSIHAARRVPIPLYDKVKLELKKMKDSDIISEITEPTEWCSPIVPVLKPSGDVRICVDLKKLNEKIQREKFIIPTLDDVLHRLKGSKIFTKLDAQSGFHQIPLDESSAKLTTFITPFGRFYFNRLPFGVSSAPEIYQRIMESILCDMTGVICYFDDILIHAETLESHNEILENVLQKLKEVGLQLNESKCEYRKEEIAFLGHIISAEGVRPDPSKISAISELPDPTNVDELRRYLGMINYLSRYIVNLSSISKPLNELLQKDTEWCWGQAQHEALLTIKNLISCAPTLAYYDAKKITIVEADSSSYGLGGVLLQVQEDGNTKPIAYCSRTLTLTERQYAQIEKECLAATYACEKFDRYLVGIDKFTLHTDHKPLVPLINKKDIVDTPLRCQRLLMRLMRYNCNAVFKSGKEMFISDTLSRSPRNTTTTTTEVDIKYYVEMITQSWPIADKRLEIIKEETKKDVCLSIAMEYARSGWPRYKEDVKLGARNLFPVRGSLTIHNGLLLFGDRIAIPYSQRQYILEKIHEGHQGITKCRQRAAHAVWWPGISRDIKEVVSRCSFCLEKQPSQVKESLMPTPLPERPFQKVAMDICEVKNKNYLIQVDYYSRWIDIAPLTSTTSSAVILEMKKLFANFGVPETVVSDNAAQFTSYEYRQFSEDWNFEIKHSSPKYPQSNGEAERAVHTAKDFIKQGDYLLALLAYRNTPLSFLGASPAELLQNRKIRTTLPCQAKMLMPGSVNHKEVRDRDNSYKLKTKNYYDKRTRDLAPVAPGKHVVIKDDSEAKWSRQGIVTENRGNRSYLIQSNGSEIIRNRRHIRENKSTPTSSPRLVVNGTSNGPVSRPGIAEQGTSASTSQPGLAQQETSASTNQPGLVGPSTTAESTGQSANLSSSPRVTDNSNALTTRSGRVIKTPQRYCDAVTFWDRIQKEAARPCY